MRKFKLIKCYPGSLPIGTEVNYSEEHKIYNYNGGNFYSELPKHQVENLPEFWKEVKEPVFISDDGVEMFVGDIYWSNFTDFSDITSQEITDITPRDNTFSFKRFSTKEAALKYIDLNKPKYSKSDVIDALRVAEYYSGFRKPSGEEVIKHLFGE